MKIQKQLLVDINGSLVPVLVTIEADKELLGDCFVDERSILCAAAANQDALICSRHHKDRDFRILVRGESIAAALQNQQDELKSTALANEVLQRVAVVAFTEKSRQYLIT